MAVDHGSVDTLFKKVDEFFMGEGPVHKTMRSLARRLNEQGIDYALAGGMALVLYGYRRETVDVDFLLTPEGLNRLENNLGGREYLPLFPGVRKRFRDTETDIEIDFIITGEYPGDGKPKPVSFPNPGEPLLRSTGYESSLSRR